MQLSDLFSACCSIGCVTLPSSSQQCFLTIEASVASERSSKPPHFCPQPSLKQLVTSFTHTNLQTALSLFGIKLVVAQLLKEQSAET